MLVWLTELGLEAVDRPVEAPVATFGRPHLVEESGYALRRLRGGAQDVEGYLGHLDPKTGKVEEFQSPGGPESKPYAIDVTSDGAIWYVETGDETKNMLVRFNPETKKFQTWPIPGGGGTVRNMEIDKHGDLWLAESGVGRISRVKITPGKSTAQ